MKRILIIGLGKSGAAALKLAAAKGLHASGFDEGSPAEPENGWGDPEFVSVVTRFDGGDLPDADLTVISPGIPPESKLAKLARASNSPIVGELDFAASFATVPMAAVTGTNGKTTVTRMTAAILGGNALPAGNIGLPLSEAVLDETAEALVVEASSFQLENAPKFSPETAAILNIAPDHLDRHASLREYADAKFNILANIRDPANAILNHSLLGEFDKRFPNAIRPMTFSAETKDADIHLDTQKRLTSDRLDLPPLRFPTSAIRGKHDIENLMAAAALAAPMLTPAELARNLAETAESFEAPPHRIQLVAEIEGVDFIDDSKATNPAAMEAALKRFDTPVNLIAGGLGKKLPFSSLVPLAAKIKKAFLYGESKNDIEKEWKGEIECETFDSFEAATLAAAKHSSHGDTVLLSPGCASMDLFENYKERGLAFQRIANTLKSCGTTFEKEGKRV
jgi:UDP-N-acetylmuramoylalanine--D-glutamate ligase